MQRHRVLGMAALLAVAGCAPAGQPGSPASTGPAASSVGAVASPTYTTAPTPTEVTAVDGVPAKKLELGRDTAPIDIAYAFGSIWVALHHTDEVVRIDPVTMAVIARVPIGKVTTGPGWFAVLDDAIWVSNQNGVGLTPIDPTTNTTGDAVGTLAPCGQPVLALGSIWQSACDAGQVMRIDPVKRTAENISSHDHDFLIQAGDRILITRKDGSGIDAFDPRARAVTRLSDGRGMPIGFDGKTVWLSDDVAITRIDPVTGKVVSTLAIDFAGWATFRDGRAWIAAGHDGISEVDLATNQVLRSLAATQYPSIVRYFDGSLWLTSFEENTLWRLTP